MDDNKLLKLSIFCFKIVGLRLEGQSTLQHAEIFVLMLSIVFVSILNVLEVYLTWSSVEDSSKSETIAFYSKVLYGMAFFLFNRQKLKEMTDKAMSFSLLKKDESLDKRIVSTTAKWYRYYKIYIGLFAFAVSAYFIDPLFSWGFPIEMYKLCDVNLLWCYSIYYTFQVILDIGSDVFDVGFDSLFLYFVLIIYFELESIKMALEKIDYEMSYGVVKRKLVRIVDHHAVVIEFLREMNNVFSTIFLIQYFGATFSVCLSLLLLTFNGIPPSLTDFLNYGAAIALFSVQFMYKCYCGDLLQRQSLSVYLTAFHTKWYSSDSTDIKKTLIPLMIRCQTSPPITIGQMFQLDMSKIVDLFRSAFSVFTFINQMRRKHHELQ